MNNNGIMNMNKDVNPELKVRTGILATTVLAGVGGFIWHCPTNKPVGT